MSANIAALLYLVAGVLFILALRGLSSPSTSRAGNRYGMIGMAVAVATTLLLHLPPLQGLLLIALGAGMGGGSSDAATTLLALNTLWKTAVSNQQLIDLSVQLGADVPVFVFGENALAEGIGEQLLALTLPPAWYVVLCPPVMVPTAAVFAHPELKRDSKKVIMQGFSGQRFQRLEGLVGADGLLADVADAVNDLQPLVVKLYPEVGRHLAWLSKAAAVESCGPAMMTGSGACVFAPFASEGAARAVGARGRTRSRHRCRQRAPRHDDRPPLPPGARPHGEGRPHPRGVRRGTQCLARGQAAGRARIRDGLGRGRLGP